MLDLNDFSSVRLSLASPEQTKGWSYGEVSKPETINYRTLKPERDGLFCERIFGPTKDFECACGKYKKYRYKGVICDKCGVEVTHSSVRRERMGHIQLAAPVAHVWFVKVTPSRLGLLLDLSPRKLEQVIYFAKFIVTRVNEDAREKIIQQLIDEFDLELMQRKDTSSPSDADDNDDGFPVDQLDDESQAIPQPAIMEEERLQEELDTKIKELRDIRTLRLLGVNEYRELKSRWGSIFHADMGAESILEILTWLDLDKLGEELRLEIATKSGQQRKKAIKRLRVVESFLKQGVKPEWMILTVLPVLPPELRPMVQLDGGRFATSDLNDLYRRVINRNNRLRRLMEMGTPEVIIRNEKRMLQEAVDSLIDSERHGRAVTTSSGHKLKSLSDMLRGKQGHFRQNLLGKRVDYSGRSVIVSGPELKLHQCGLPKRMALELFKPFVMRRLIARGLAYSIRSAKRAVEQEKEEVWDILDEVIDGHPIMLNRAPTLHRLSIQAFQPVLIDGSAIQVHPLVCAAFNADFDGDQMAVHVPLSNAAINEAKEFMMATKNMMLPSSGDPSVTPTLEMVLGCYYLTSVKEGAKGEGMAFSDFEDAKLAHALKVIDLDAEIRVRRPNDDEILTTSVGRIIFNDTLPDEFEFCNEVVGKKALKRITTECCRTIGFEATAPILDKLKFLGFKYSTISGATIAVTDLKIPLDKPVIMTKAEKVIEEISAQYQDGLITEDERYQSAVSTWMAASDELTKCLENSLDRQGSVYMMANSGAKGNIGQLRQMAGMRGLMSDPSGRIIELPIKANFREGLSVLEYFISTHGARKGLADTALRTSDSGYLTRRLIDVTQEIIITEEDCGTNDGLWIIEPEEKDKSIMASLAERITGRVAGHAIVHPETGEIIVERNEEINAKIAANVVAAGIKEALVRSPMTCQSRHGMCRLCYGEDIGRGHLVEIGTAVGIIAAQSIGEPGTQLTMRTFHTGGAAGLDITSGLPRVEELLESRNPKGQAIIAEIDGVIEIHEIDDSRRIKIVHTGITRDDYTLPPDYEVLIKDGQWIDANKVLAQPVSTGESERDATEIVPAPLVSKVGGTVEIRKKHISIVYDEKEEWEQTTPNTGYMLVRDGDSVKAGDQLTDGSLNPQDILRVMGPTAVQRYIVNEIQKVYRSQGVTIHDKHVENIVAQMLRKVRIDEPGDTGILPGELISKLEYEDLNAKMLAEGGEPATAHPVLLGITRASLNTKSWLAAASFQETTRVLTEAAINGNVDHLVGLKENVIIGKLIPTHRLIALSHELHEPSEQAQLGLEALMEEGPDDQLGLSPAVETGSGDIIEEPTNEIIGEAVDEMDSATDDKVDDISEVDSEAIDLNED